MECPTDGATLLMTERQGVEIDYCPTCRGVWLDRGELDKILERGRAEDDDDDDRVRTAPAPPLPRPDGGYRDDRYDPRREHHDRDDDRHDRSYDPRYGKKRKKKSFLDDMFDFG